MADTIEIGQLLAGSAAGMTRDDIETIMEALIPDGWYGTFGETYPMPGGRMTPAGPNRRGTDT